MDENFYRRTTSIRPKSLRRANCVIEHLGGTQSVTDFNSQAVDDLVRKLVKKHNIILPPDCAFETAAGEHKRTHETSLKA